MSKGHKLKFTAVLIPCEEGGFTAICNEIPGAISEGETEEEALENLKDATLGVLALQAEMTSHLSPKPIKPRGSRRGTF
jgi:predicted RNase H-like HicB family nuclease